MSKTPTKRGGKRPGAGRKPKDNPLTATFCVAVSAIDLDNFKRLTTDEVRATLRRAAKRKATNRQG